jgi:glycerate 2-kinase
MRDHLLQAFQAGIQAVQPDRAIRKFVELTTDGCKVADQVWPTQDLRVLTVGKAAGKMAETLADILVDRVSRGLVVSPQQGKALPSGWQAVQGDHPLPGTGSLAAGQAVRDLLTGCTADTLILVGVSGGATALLIDPPAEISLHILRSIYQTLLASGADIYEMNAVRSRLDRLKGGGLVDLAAPGQVVGLILSDVVGDALAVIGSGLTDRPTAHNTLIGNNDQACEAAAAYLQTRGYQTQIVTTQMQGEASSQGREIAKSIQAMPLGTALIYGGETTVTLPANCRGRGGRNQELVLAAAIELDTAAPRLNLSLKEYHQWQKQANKLSKSSPTVWIGSIGTDGIDGTSPAAGAIAHTYTSQLAWFRGLDAQEYLERHDSYGFFDCLTSVQDRQLGQTIITGATGTNVADLSITLRAF